MKQVLKIHPEDNVMVALKDLTKNDTITLENKQLQLVSDIPAKHKFAARDFSLGDAIIMYGVTVGKASREIKRGGIISVDNIVHDIDPISKNTKAYHWEKPNTDLWKNASFSGYYRDDGKVGRY